MDFVKSLGVAQGLPPGAASIPFDPFTPTVQDSDPIAAPAKDPNAIPGVPEYDLTFHCQRFYVGRELQEVLEGGAKVFADRDETLELKEVMDKCLKGVAVILHRNQTILGDGSVVVWMEWTERKPKAPKPRSEREHLTESELRSPERLTPRSAVQDAPATSDDAEDVGPSTADEPDW